MIFHWPVKRRIPWLLGSLALMFGSAYSILRLFGIAGAVSGWIGLPQYAAQIPMLEAQARWWEALAVTMPFLAALLLGFGRDEVDRRLDRAEPSGQTVATYSVESREWLAPIARYLLRLAVSGLGTLAFMVLLLLVLFVFYKLGIHTS
jgi:hypothetical protein